MINPDFSYVSFIDSNGEILTVKGASKINNPEEGYDDFNKWTVVYLRENIEDFNLFIKNNYYDFSTDSFKSREPKPNTEAYWNNNSWTWDQEKFLDSVRRERTNRLYACDWTQLPDSPLSDEDKELWRTYRQQLRDITNDLSGISSLDEITWPESPINT